ncbi:hypothetical protein HYY69_02665 [Candidatus Woesearchaeota archaeon]|nr:hypothetical protein [Candidatus Woesearchaeota archaeon]
MNIIRMIIIVGLFSLIIGCSNEDKRVNEVQDKTTLKEGFILTAKAFVPEGTYLGKDGIGQIGPHTEKMYVKDDKVRIDIIYPNKEQRMYTLTQGDTVTIHSCVKEETWICKVVTSMKKLQDTKGLQELDEQILASLKKLPDKQLLELNAKCFEIPGGSNMCYHPDYQITLYESRKNGFTWEATALELTTPDDDLFVLPQ